MNQKCLWNPHVVLSGWLKANLRRGFMITPRTHEEFWALDLNEESPVFRDSALTPLAYRLWRDATAKLGGLTGSAQSVYQPIVLVDLGRSAHA